MGLIRFSTAFFSSLLSMHRPLRASTDVHSEVSKLYRQYGYILKRRCFKILRDPSLVEDAMQEIFLTLCRCYTQYQGEPQRILAWLYRITTTHCLQLLQKDQRWTRNLEELLQLHVEKETHYATQLDVEGRVVLDAFLHSLPEEERAAVLYRYVSGMTQEEIAEVMDVTRDQVRRWLKHFQRRGRIVFREEGLR